MYYKIMMFVIMLCLVNRYSIANQDLEHPKEIDWTFDGVTGKFDRESIQRGFKVYREVCSACHSLKALSFRNLIDIGFTEDQAKSLATEYSVQDGPNDQGSMYNRSARLADHIPGPYSNEQEARASNNGAFPPDLSLIVKARANGENYVYSILTGFTTPPENIKLGENMHYNPYFNGKQIAMTPPLVTNGQVSYTDGVNPTIEQMAFDVVNFLQWIAEPEMEERKSLGIRVIIFMLIFTMLFYFANKRVWQRLKIKAKSLK